MNALTNLFGEVEALHQSQLPPAANKFHVGNGEDGKHYWITPPDVYENLNVRFNFDFDPCPYPLPEGFDGLTCGWGSSSFVNPPFGSIMHKGPNDKRAKKKGPTAWVRKAIAEQQKGKRVVLVYPVDKWLLMLLEAGAKVENLGDVKWLATEDGSAGKGTGRHIACFILEPSDAPRPCAWSCGMTRTFTVVRLPGGQCAGLGEDGEVTVAEAIASYRAHAASKLIEAMEVLDAADEDFRVVVERGVHRVTPLKTLQEGRA